MALLFLFCTVCLCSTWISVAEDRELVIINTDPGIDDAWAILLAVASPELDILGLTVSFGNLQNMTDLTNNALRILEIADRYDIPVFAGVDNPVSGSYHDLGSSKFHGKDGLGDIGFPLPRGNISSMGAVEFIIQSCRAAPGKINIVSVGPLTNLAVALSIEPNLPQLVNRIYCMGGTVKVPGNVSPMGEANVAKDSHAAHQVFAAGFKITMAGLDVTSAIHMSPEYFKSLKDLGKCGKFIYEIAQFYLGAEKSEGYPWSPCHDPSSIMAMVHPDIYNSTNSFPVGVYTTHYPDPMDGVLLVDRRGGPNLPPPPAYSTTLLMEVDQEEFKKFFKERISTLP